MKSAALKAHFHCELKLKAASCVCQKNYSSCFFRMHNGTCNVYARLPYNVCNKQQQSKHMHGEIWKHWKTSKCMWTVWIRRNSTYFQICGGHQNTVRFWRQAAFELWVQQKDTKGIKKVWFQRWAGHLWAPNSLAAMKGRTANWLLEKNTYETYGICIAYACTSRIVETCMQFDLNMYAIWFKKHVYKYIPKHVFTPGSTFPNAISDIGLVQCPCWRPTTPLHRGKWTWYLNGSVPLNSSFTGGVWYNQWLANTHKVNWVIDGHCESMMSIFNHQCMEQSLKKMPVYWPIAFICDWLILDCNRRKPPNTKYEDIWGI